MVGYMCGAKKLQGFPPFSRIYVNVFLAMLRGHLGLAVERSTKR